MNDELYHSRGAWKTHKYLKKIGNRYIYAKDQMTGVARSAGNTMQQMRAQASKQVANAKRAARQAIISGRQTAKRVRTRVNEATGVNARKRMQTYAGQYKNNQRRSAAATQNYRRANSSYQRAQAQSSHATSMMRRPTPNGLKGEARSSYNKQVGQNSRVANKRLGIETQKRNKAAREMSTANKRTQTAKRNYQANKKAYENSIAGKVDKGIAKAKRTAIKKGAASRRALNKMVGVGAKEARDKARQDYIRTAKNAKAARERAKLESHTAKNAGTRLNAARKTARAEAMNMANSYLSTRGRRTPQQEQAAAKWLNNRVKEARPKLDKEMERSRNASRRANNAWAKTRTAERYRNEASQRLKKANDAYNKSLIGRAENAKKKASGVFNKTKKKANSVYKSIKKKRR